MWGSKKGQKKRDGSSLGAKTHAHTDTDTHTHTHTHTHMHTPNADASDLRRIKAVSVRSSYTVMYLEILYRAVSSRAASFWLLSFLPSFFPSLSLFGGRGPSACQVVSFPLLTLADRCLLSFASLFCVYDTPAHTAPRGRAASLRLASLPVEYTPVPCRVLTA